MLTSKFIFLDLDKQKQHRYETNRLHQLENKTKMMNKLKVWRQGLGQKGTLKFDKEQALAKLIGIVKSNNWQPSTCKRKKSNQGKL